MAEPDAAEQLFLPAPSLAGRGSALVKALLFLLLAAGLVLAGGALLRAFPTFAPLAGALGPFERIQIVFALAVLAAGALTLAVTGEPVALAGLGGRRRGRHLALGLAAGAATMAGLIFILVALGLARLDPPVETPRAATGAVLAYVSLFAMVALAEQGAFLGYPLVQLSRALGFWPAAVVMAAVFGAMHIASAGESWTGLGVAALFALIMAWSFRLTGSLWFALGAQTAWDFTESFLFGAPNSGETLPGALNQLTALGPVGLTGGAVGPEGGAAAVVAMLALAMAVQRLFGPREGVTAP